MPLTNRRGAPEGRLGGADVWALRCYGEEKERQWDVQKAGSIVGVDLECIAGGV